MTGLSAKILCASTLCDGLVFLGWKRLELLPFFNYWVSTFIFELSVHGSFAIEGLEVSHFDFFDVIILIEIQLKLVAEKFLFLFISIHSDIIIRLRLYYKILYVNLHNILLYQILHLFSEINRKNYQFYQAINCHDLRIGKFYRLACNQCRSNDRPFLKLLFSFSEAVFHSPANLNQFTLSFFLTRPNRLIGSF